MLSARWKSTRIFRKRMPCSASSPVTTTTTGKKRRDDEALEAVRRSVELDANFWLGYSRLGMLCAWRGDYVQARQCAEKAMASAPWSPYSSSLMAVVLMHEGQLQSAESLLAALRADSYGGPVGLMCYHAMRGETEMAAEWAVKVGEPQ